MATIVLGSITVETTASSGQPQADTYGSMKSEIAGFVSGQDQPAILSDAGKGILRCIDDLNIHGVFDFGRKTASDATLVNGTRTYSVATDFFAIDTVQLVATSDSNVARRLEYMSWHEFNSEFEKQTAEGSPRWWTCKNTYDDQNIIVYPEPDAGAAADYTLRITYYERIERPTSDSDIIVAPREISHVLKLYGEFYVSDRWEDDETRTRRKLGEYVEARDSWEASRKRVPGRLSHMRIPVDDNRSNLRIGGRTKILYVDNS